MAGSCIGWFRGSSGSARLTLGLDDLKRLSQPSIEFYDAINILQQVKNNNYFNGLNDTKEFAFIFKQELTKRVPALSPRAVLGSLQGSARRILSAGSLCPPRAESPLGEASAAPHRGSSAGTAHCPRTPAPDPVPVPAPVPVLAPSRPRRARGPARPQRSARPVACGAAPPGGRGAVRARLAAGEGVRAAGNAKS